MRVLATPHPNEDSPISFCSNQWLFQSSIIEMAAHLYGYFPRTIFYPSCKTYSSLERSKFGIIIPIFQVKSWGTGKLSGLSWSTRFSKNPGVSGDISWSFSKWMSIWELRVSASPPRRTFQASLSLVLLLTTSCRDALRLGCDSRLKAQGRKMD